MTTLTSRRQTPLRRRILRGDVTVSTGKGIIAVESGLPHGSVSLRLPSGRAAHGNQTIRNLRTDYGWNGASHRAPRFRSLRGDATVQAAERAIEAWFGLPAGSVSLRLPDGRAARGNKKVQSLRSDYGWNN